MAKKSTYKEIITAVPEASNDKVRDFSNALDDILAIKELFQSAGGERLIRVLQNNCGTALAKIVYVSKNEPDLQTLLGLIATYSANMDLLSSVKDISMEDEIRAQLDSAVVESVE